MVDKKVLVVGAYGTGNLGDEAILSGILNHLKVEKKVSEKEILVFSRDPKETRRIHGVNSRCKNLSDLLKSDEVIIGGGELFQNQGNMVLKYSLLGLLAKIFRKRLSFFAVGVSSDINFLGKLLMRIVFRFADSISVRDKESKRRLLDLGIKKRIVRVSDPAFYVTPISQVAASLLLKGEGVRYEKGVIQIAFVSQNLGNNELHLTFLEVLKEILDNNSDVQIIFVPFTHHVDKPLDRDLLYGEWLGNKLKNDRFKVLKNRYTPDQIMGIMGLMGLVVSTRLHPLIFAAKMNVASIGMDLFDKTRSFCFSHNIPLVKLGDFEKIGYFIQSEIDKKRFSPGV